MSTIDSHLPLTAKLFGGEIISLHPKSCLNTRFRALDCSICAAVCPAKGAITIAGGGPPVLDNNACLHCGLCLHRCPTEAFTQPDRLSGTLIKMVTALPVRPVDLICPRHPHPAYGPASQAVQTQRCLAALSPATLLELASLNNETWLDDTPCPDCPLGQVHPAMTKVVKEANSWAGLLDKTLPIRRRTESAEVTSPAVGRPVYDAASPPLSRRGLWGMFKPSDQTPTTDEKIELVKGGKMVPVSKRLPPLVPHQRTKILALLEKSFSTQPSMVNCQSSMRSDQLPVLNLQLDPARCTACGLCAKFCPTGALKFLSDGASFALTFQTSLCLGSVCHICGSACPEQAVSTQAVGECSDLFNRIPLIVGDLSLCQKCQQPLAQAPDLPNTCFACRPKNNLSFW